MQYFIRLVKSLKPYRTEHWLMLFILFYSLVGIVKYYITIGFLLNATYAICGAAFIWVILRHWGRCPLTGMSRFLYVVLTAWTVLLTFRMLIIDDVRATFTEYKGITTWLLAYFESQLFLPNMMPLFLLTLSWRKGFDFGYLWRIMWMLCIAYVCYYPIAFWSMTHYSWSFDTLPGTVWGEEGTYGDFIRNSTRGIAAIAPVVIMVYFKKYIPNKQWRWFLVAFVGSMLIQAYLARRGGLATSALYLILAWMMYSFSDKKTSKIKMIFIAVFAAVTCVVIFNKAADSFLSTLAVRGYEDTRAGVEENFYADMNSITDWIFGRGWFGQYYDKIFGMARNGVETGYLTLILRGGLLYLIPYVGMLALSFFNGYFRSKNLFCKSFAIMCLMQIICLYPFGWPQFDFLHFVIWLGCFVCNNKNVRLMNDDQIKHAFFN